MANGANDGSVNSSIPSPTTVGRKILRKNDWIVAMQEKTHAKKIKVWLRGRENTVWL
jgi:hypothetical protein